MRILTVIPIGRGVGKNTLTYFSAREVSVGSVVLVPLRKKSVPALVIENREVAEEKAAIKAGAFGLKRVGKILGKPFPDSFIAAARHTADFHASSVGALLYALTPEPLLKKICSRDAAHIHPITHLRYIVQADDEERYIQYRTLVRESFHKGNSVFIVVPTIQDAKRTASALAKGISEYLLLFHSDQSKKHLDQAFRTLGSRTHPLLIISTPSFLSLLPDNTDTLILDRENSPAYKQIARPYIDWRVFVKEIAASVPLRFVVGDSFLSTETVYDYHNEAYEELIPLRSRVQKNTVPEIVDMREYKPDLRGILKTTSTELQALIEEMRSVSERTFVFVARKGLAPTTVCGDCGTVLTCKHCDAPLVLHKTETNRRVYLCHRCGEKQDTTIRCKHCTSWKLVPLGVGAELVAEQIREHFPTSCVLRLDSESAKNRTETLRLIEKFYQTPGSILVGTEQSLPYLTKPVGASAIASFDTLFSIPNFRINERIMYVLVHLINISERRFIIQTRQPNHEVIQNAREGNIADFYIHELSMRKALHYPPFSVLIKISRAPNTNEVLHDMEQLGKLLSPYTMSISPSFLKNAGMAGLSGILKIPKEVWPDERIISVLRSLPPSFEVRVNPESIW